MPPKPKKRKADYELEKAAKMTQKLTSFGINWETSSRPPSVQASTSNPPTTSSDCGTECMPVSEALSEKKDTTHRQSGWNPAWVKECPWLVNSADGMHCWVCVKHAQKGKRHYAFIEKKSQSYRHDTIMAHSRSQIHSECNTSEMTRRAGNTIPVAVAPSIDVEHWAIEGCFRVLYTLVKSEIAHHTNYQTMLKMCEDMGCSYLQALKVGNKTTYSSNTIIDEMLTIINEVLLDEFIPQVRQSPAWSIMIDEATDIAVTKQLGIYVMYMHKDGEKRQSVVPRFLEMVSLKDGTAATITDSILATLREHNLPVDRLYSFASDGASVMMGRVNGVAAKLKAIVPELISIHCAAHRLNLAAGQATTNIKYLAKFSLTIKNLYWFYHNSSVRTEKLLVMQSLLDTDKLKLQGGNQTRWMSTKQAVMVLRRVLHAVLADLGEQAQKDPVAKGLCIFIENFKFIATVVMMIRVHETLGQSFLVFQKKSLFFEQAAGEIRHLKNVLVNLARHPQCVKQELQSWLEAEEMAPFGLDFTEEKWAAFNIQVLQPYLEALSSNLENRFPEMETLGLFKVFDPETAALPENTITNNPDYGADCLDRLARHFPRHLTPCTLKDDWLWCRSALIESGELKGKSLEDALLYLARQDVYQLRPQIATVAAIGLTVPVSTADVERLFSSMKRVKTAHRNRLKDQKLSACIRVSHDGPSSSDFNFKAAVVKFYRKNPNRVLKCSDRSCSICAKQ